MTDDEIRDAIVIMRQRASRVGPQHAFWDLIFDAEAILEDRPSIVTRDVLEREIERALLII